MPRKAPFWIAAATCLLVAPQLRAQARGPLELGVKGGIPFATMSVENNANADLESRTGFGGGAFLRVPLGGIGLQIEALFVQKGVTQTAGDIDPFDELRVELDYIEVPVLATVPFAIGGGVSPYVFGGPAFAFEVGCTMAADGPVVDVEIDCGGGEGADFELPTKSVDIGATLGAGLRVPAGGGSLLLEGRYTLGLVNIDDTGEDNVKNRAAMVLIGFSFPVK